MKRNMYLIKLILKYVEHKDENNGRHLPTPEFPDYTDQQVSYHVELCNQAGYVEVLPTGGGAFLRSLTWSGHNALDELRKEFV